MATRLTIRWESTDISDDVTLMHGRSNAFGWSCYELTFADERIGFLYCGRPSRMREGFTVERSEEG
jgi:hypothetical protein